METCSESVLAVCSFFFFKQKTAYELRISDWSSDVRSSDLDARAGFHEVAKDIVLRAIIDRDDMGPIISRLPTSVRVERSRDTVRSRTTDGHRSEERRVGKECVSTCRSRWSP